MGKANASDLLPARRRHVAEGTVLLLAILILAFAAVVLVAARAVHEAFDRLPAAISEPRLAPVQPSPAPLPLPRPGGAPIGDLKAQAWPPSARQP